MTAELVDAFGRKSGEDLGERGDGETAGGGDGDGAICGEDVGVANLGDAVEVWAETIEQVDGNAAEESAVFETAAPCGLEGIANGSDRAALGQMEKGPGNSREEMSVLVGVEVGDVDARALELLHLGEGLALDIVLADGATKEGLDEIDDGGAEGFAVAAEEGRDAVGVGDGCAVGEDDVTAYAEGGVGMGDGDGVVKRWASSHEGGGGESVGLVEFGDGAIDACGESEIICVDDEAGGHCS